MKINAINIKLDLEQKKKTGLFETNEFLLRGKIFLSAIRVFFLEEVLIPVKTYNKAMRVKKNVHTSKAMRVK